MTQKMALLGDEAVAMAAIQSGIKSSYAYPGTPATEIQETIQKYVSKHPESEINCGWSVNEKVAYEEAVGASLVGRRVLVNMKHVGVNVAADPFMCSSITGAGGGLVLAAADDPSMHSSQNEQDSRFYAKFAKIPCFEPMDSQQAYDMTRYAFKLSEKTKLPIMIKLSTRISHTRSIVEFKDAENKVEFSRPKDFMSWTLLPSNARIRYNNHLKKQTELIKESEESPFNNLHIENGAGLGVVVAGNARNYFHEVIKTHNFKCSYLEIGQYPLPDKQLREILSKHNRVVVIEDGYPVVEEIVLRTASLMGKQIQIMGRLFAEKVMPPDGELSTEIVTKALGLSVPATNEVPKETLSPRPPQLCKGCSHADAYNALNKALEGKQDDSIVFGDIGCYTLGYYPPYNTIQSCLCMGASISMSKAAAENGLKYSVGIIGDSTFNHSGITPLLEGIKRKTPFTVMLLDNSYTAMTRWSRNSLHWLRS